MQEEIEVVEPSETSEGLMPSTLDASVQDVDINLGLVAYTDGSCWPTSNGYMGWGVHGYTYPVEEVSTPVMVMDYHHTDCGYRKKNELGWKFGSQTPKFVVPQAYLDFMGSSLKLGTNNIAEIHAVTKTLQYALDNKVVRITIFADSEYTRQSLMQWCPGWERNGWIKHDGREVANKEDWKVAYSLLKQYKEKGGKIQMFHIKAHTGLVGNVQADALAGIAANYSTAGIFHETLHTTPVKGYWKLDADRNPLLNFKRVYFNSNEKYNTPGTYFQADTGAADHLIGKRIPETGLSILKLNEPVKVIEDVKRRQYDVAQEVNTIIMMKLDRVYDKEIYPYLQEHSHLALRPGKGNLNLNWFDRKPVTVEIGTTGLSMRAIDCFNMLEELLGKFQANIKGETKNTGEGNPVNVHDITSEFYEYNEVQVRKDRVMKCTLKPEFGVGFADMTLYIDEPHEDSTVKLKVPLILGTDLLPRNNLKKIESLNPKVYLITWRESSQSVRYATAITCDAGIGIWSNFFADRIFFSKP